MIRLGPLVLRARLRTRACAARLLPSLLAKPKDWDRLSYSEKLRWRCRHPDPAVDYGRWVDKARARELVSGWLRVAGLYAVVRRPREIDPDLLPRTYVMKATHGWNMSLLVREGVVQGRNRSTESAGRPADAACLRQVARDWLGSRRERKRRSRERHYALVRPAILFEEFLDPIDHELQLFLFRGRLRLAMVFYRGFLHEGSTHRMYDANWSLLEPGSADAAESYELAAPPTPRPPPALLDSLEDLCRAIDHVRVDLYACGGTWFFSEFTFTHAAGEAGNIGKYDAGLGRYWEG